MRRGKTVERPAALTSGDAEATGFEPSAEASMVSSRSTGIGADGANPARVLAAEVSPPAASPASNAP
ncbi:MAG: hypothetical protein AMXMBFR56_80670 [Polyangiaceae bacterium]